MADFAVVVVGASAGGTEALRTFVRDLPSELPAAVFVVQHLYAETVSHLPQLLSRTGSLPAMHPQDGQAIAPGHIYVAPPNSHMLLREPGIISLDRGPRENLHRPAIDPLFRSAARTYGPRTIGAILTGSKDDGAAGLLSIKMRGGSAIVQAPDDAAYPEMPLSAIDQVPEIDRIIPLVEMAQAVTDLAWAVAGGEPMQPNKDEQRHTSEQEDHDSGEAASADEVLVLICPECGGALRPVTDGELSQYRCHVGHLYGEASLHVAYDEAVEQALWAALRALKEQASLNRHMAQRLTIPRLGQEYFDQAEASDRHAQQIEAILRRLGTATTPGSSYSAG